MRVALLVLVACAGPAARSSSAPIHNEGAMADPAPVVRARWRGAISVGGSLPGDEPSALETLTIRDDAAYDAFIARLPARRIQQRQPAPPSTDPLRARPPIDFAHEVLIAVVRPQTLSAVPDVEVATDRGVLHVRYTLPPRPPEARPYGIGVYHAIVVPRPPGAIAFDVVDAPTP